MKIVGGACVLAGLFVLSAPCAAAEVREAHYVMGTVLEIAVEAPSVERGRRWIRLAVAESRRLDRDLTSFDEASALSALNRSAGRGWQRVPDDLFRVLSFSQRLSRETGGSFDVTVGPLVALWRGALESGRWPSGVELAAARATVGAEKLRLRAPNEVELTSDGMVVDLGGIGKGYAADRMAEHFRAVGARAALVNFGESSIVAVGAPSGRDGWPIWVRRGRGLDGPLLLRDMALSTSRSLARGGRLANRRLGHIFDPRRGEPLAEDLQATVVGPSAAEAEAWSKALLIDPERTLRALDALPRSAGLLYGRSASGDWSRRFAALTGFFPGGAPR